MVRKTVVLSAAVLLLAFASSVAARHLQQAESTNATALPGAGARPSFANFSSAIEAANVTSSNLTTLLAAVQAAGVARALNGSTAWTILAPTNQAFETRLREDLNMTPAALLDPANNATLLEVLSYHVIPSAAVNSSSLTNGQRVVTALAGAEPLRVRLEAGKKPRFVGATNTATVQVPDIKVGLSVIHVVNDVLLPKGIGKGSGKNN